MLNLIKKDFLIIKKTWIIVFIIALIIPLFFDFVSAKEGVIVPAALTLISMTMVLSVMTLSHIYSQDEMYPKAAAMITTVGYPRDLQIIERYVLAYLFYLYCVCGYALETLVVSSLSPITMAAIAASLCSYTLIVSLYIAVTNKFGEGAGRYVFIALVMLVSIGPSILSSLNFHPNLEFLTTISDLTITLVFAAVSLVALAVSLTISLRSYRIKEL